ATFPACKSNVRVEAGMLRENVNNPGLCSSSVPSADELDLPGPALAQPQLAFAPDKVVVPDTNSKPCSPPKDSGLKRMRIRFPKCASAGSGITLLGSKKKVGQGTSWSVRTRANASHGDRRDVGNQLDQVKMA
ncbi:unnamed protein product, partial [Choristocarpus tenellus]